jgi:hypothetical protein
MSGIALNETVAANVTGAVVAAVIDTKPKCGSGESNNPEDYDLPLHIAAVCKQNLHLNHLHC